MNAVIKSKISILIKLFIMLDEKFGLKSLKNSTSSSTILVLLNRYFRKLKCEI